MNATPSTVLSLGLGSFGGVALLLTLGYGAASAEMDGKFICLHVGDVFLHGVQQGGVFRHGVQEGDEMVHGVQQGQRAC